MNKSNKLDFTGQPIYVGLDVHKKSWSVSILSEQCEHKTLPNLPKWTSWPIIFDVTFRVLSIIRSMRLVLAVSGSMTN